MSKDAPLVICEHLKHPLGVYGCFRCIDSDLLPTLTSMFHKKKVDVFSVTVGPHGTISKGEKPNPITFFTFLHENNICLKIFFTEHAFTEEYINVKILETIPSEIAGEAIAGEAIAGEAGEQPNFLQKFTTYYEYQYETAAGAQKNFAFVLEFADNIEILKKERISTKRCYVVLNKFCNNKLTIQQKTSKKFHDEILGALEILNSHGYGHADPHLDNVVDCGESSDPQYKLIDFGNMRKTLQYYKNAHSDKLFFESRLERLPKSGGTKHRNKRKRSRVTRHRNKRKPRRV